MYNYLQTGELTNDDKTDKLTLLMADMHTLEGDLMYRFTTPRNKKETRLRPIVKRLCVPLSFRFDLIDHTHRQYGHFGVVRSYLSLSQRYYWKSLYCDVADYCRSCDTCLRAKRNYNTQVAKLHLLPVPDGPGHTWSIDHKVLTRPTRSGLFWPP